MARIYAAIVWSVALMTTLLICGCGGGGGSATAPPIDDTLFSPNYISALDGLYHWDHLPIKVAFELPSDWMQRYPDNADLYVKAAQEWNQTGRQAFYTVAASSSSADVVVQFVSYTQLSIPGAQGVTQSTHTSDGRMQSATVQVALDNARVAQISATEAQSTIAHELGHALGIIGHSPNPTDLMYATHYYGSDLRPSALDLNTAMSAYPAYFTSSASGLVKLHEFAAPETGPLITEEIQ